MTKSNSPSLKAEVLNIKLEPHLKAMLLKMREDSDSTMAHIIRTMVEARYRMLYDNQPHCVDGSLCRCPAMHTVKAHEHISAEELLQKTTTESEQHEFPAAKAQ